MTMNDTAVEFPCLTELAAGEHGTIEEQNEARRVLAELDAIRPLALMGARARRCTATESYEVITQEGARLYYAQFVLHYILTGEIWG